MKWKDELIIDELKAQMLERDSIIIKLTDKITEFKHKLEEAWLQL